MSSTFKKPICIALLGLIVSYSVMSFADELPITPRSEFQEHDINAECLIESSLAYDLPPLVLYAIHLQEAGWIGMKKQNNNKSYDYGVQNINSIWLEELSNQAQVHITEELLVNNECINIEASAYILDFYRSRAWGSLRKAIGYYHSGHKKPMPAAIAKRALNYRKSVRQKIVAALKNNDQVAMMLLKREDSVLPIKLFRLEKQFKTISNL